MPSLVTSYSTLSWSSDGSSVTKTRLAAVDARRRFRTELRINQLLNGHRPPVETPALLDFDTQHRSLTFVALPGEPLGPKYPTELAAADIDAAIDVADRLRSFNPKRRWFRRLNSGGRLALARRAGLLSGPQTAELMVIADLAHSKLRFAHGDLTARNVLRCPEEPALIDWEWAGLYPDGYELAFLWFSLVDVESGRRRVEARLETDERAFLLSALLIQLWHLQWKVPSQFRRKHLATRDQLISRLVG